MWPSIDFKQKQLEYIEYPVHQTAITCLKVTPNYEFLISASEDGSIFFSKLRQYSNGSDISLLELYGGVSGMNLANTMHAIPGNTFGLNILSLTSRKITEVTKSILWIDLHLWTG